MKCAEARERMLVADPSVLRVEGVGSDDRKIGERRLADHLESCAVCRRRARVLVEEQERLARALDTAAVEMGGNGVGTSSRRRWRTAAAGAALAAAAALGLWLAPGGVDLPNRSSSPVVEIQREPGAAGFELDAPSDGDVAVFRTGDPDVIVVWRLGPDGSS